MDEISHEQWHLERIKHHCEDNDKRYKTQPRFHSRILSNIPLFNLTSYNRVIKTLDVNATLVVLVDHEKVPDDVLVTEVQVKLDTAVLAIAPSNPAAC